MHLYVQIQDQASQEDKMNILVQLFWICIAILESDYEHEFLLGLRLLDKVSPFSTLFHPTDSYVFPGEASFGFLPLCLVFCLFHLFLSSSSFFIIFRLLGFFPFVFLSFPVFWFFRLFCWFFRSFFVFFVFFWRFKIFFRLVYSSAVPSTGPLFLKSFLPSFINSLLFWVLVPYSLPSPWSPSFSPILLFISSSTFDLSSSPPSPKSLINSSIS